MVDRVGNQTVGAAFGCDPETAFAVQRDTFHVHLLRWIACAGHVSCCDDTSRCLARVDGEDARLVAIEAIVDSVDQTVFVSDHARECTPTDQFVSAFRGQLRVRGWCVLKFVYHDVCTCCAFFAKVYFVCGGKQAALWDCNRALRRNARRQNLFKDRVGCVGHVVDGNGRCAFRQDKGVGGVAKGRDFHAFRLNAFGVGTFVRVMACLDDRGFKGVARFPNQSAVFVEHSDRTRTAVHVAFVCDHDVVVVDPLKAVGLA